MSSRRSFVVIGLGTFGGSVAAELSQLGHEVLGIDRDAARVARFADTLEHAVEADAQDIEALREAGATDCEAAIVAISDDLEVSAMCLSNLQDIGVKKVWVKVNSPTHARIVQRLGATRVVNPEEEMGAYAARSLHAPKVLDELDLPGGLDLACVSLPASMEGQEASEAAERLGRRGVTLLGVATGRRVIGIGQAHPLARGDTLIVAGEPRSLLTFAETN